MNNKQNTTNIPNWHQAKDGKVIANRDAQFWRKTGNAKEVECVLCYRNCKLQPGELGWCRQRGNDNGTMNIPHHGVLSRMQRMINGYYSGIRTYLPGMLAMGIGGTHCTAACTFCVSQDVVKRPDKLEWQGKQERGMGYDGGWMYQRGMAHPKGAIAAALRWGAKGIVLAENEPLLSFEYTYDVCRLAKEAGLKTVIYSNGFSTPGVVKKIAKYVDAVDIGIKGHLNDAFYTRYMKAPNAPDAVRQSILEWKQAGVYLLLSDLIPTMQMMDEATMRASQHALYQWVIENVGKHTPIMFGMMHKSYINGVPEFPYLLPQTAEAHEEYLGRYQDTIDYVKSFGLHYADGTWKSQPIRCHNCNDVLYELTLDEGDTAECDPCYMFSHYCNCWSHYQHVNGNRCASCGVEVPIVCLPQSEIDTMRAMVATISPAEM